MKLNELKKLAAWDSQPVSPGDQQEYLDALYSLGLDSGNFYQELEMSSRYVNTHQDVSSSASTVQLHSHAFYELICCQSTCGVEYLVGSERYRLQKGDIVIVAPGVSHRPILPENMAVPYRRDVLWLSEEFVGILPKLSPELLDGRMRPTHLVRTAGTKWEFLAELFHGGVQESENGQVGWEMAVIGNTLQLMALLNRAVRGGGTRPLRAEKPELLDRVMAYVEEHLAGKITLGEIARQFYVSESTISHVFRQKLGVSFYRCVTQRRLISAKTLIGQGQPLETVSRAVGFADYSTFYRAFKQEYGISPRQFQQMQERF
ncbi:MAG: helix-turn-helix domain-containing protein [Faecousia sp.]